MLQPGEWVPPSVYMSGLGGFRSCPAAYSLNRIVEKGLVEMRCRTWSPEQVRVEMAAGRKPGRETAEYNAALMLTAAGVAVFFQLEKAEADAVIRDLTSDLPF